MERRLENLEARMSKVEASVARLDADAASARRVAEETSHRLGGIERQLTDLHVGQRTLAVKVAWMVSLAAFVATVTTTALLKLLG